MGLLKGKSDPVDASRIREYGERFYDKLRFKYYDSEDMVELKSLYTLRTQLVKARKLLRTAEHSRSNIPMQSISVKKYADMALGSLNDDIKGVDGEIEAIIVSNEEFQESYELVTSIKGIGPVIATDLIIKTENFMTIDTARKAASYAGV